MLIFFISGLSYFIVCVPCLFWEILVDDKKGQSMVRINVLMTKRRKNGEKFRIACVEKNQVCRATFKGGNVSSGQRCCGKSPGGGRAFCGEGDGILEQKTWCYKMGRYYPLSDEQQVYPWKCMVGIRCGFLLGIYIIFRGELLVFKEGPVVINGIMGPL